jgi:hypothetical protein
MWHDARRPCASVWVVYSVVGVRGRYFQNKVWSNKCIQNAVDCIGVIKVFWKQSNVWKGYNKKILWSLWCLNRKNFSRLLLNQGHQVAVGVRIMTTTSCPQLLRKMQGKLPLLYLNNLCHVIVHVCAWLCVWMCDWSQPCGLHALCDLFPSCYSQIGCGAPFYSPCRSVKYSHFLRRCLPRRSSGGILPFTRNCVQTCKCKANSFRIHTDFMTPCSVVGGSPLQISSNRRHVVVIRKGTMWLSEGTKCLVLFFYSVQFFQFFGKGSGSYSHLDMLYDSFYDCWTQLGLVLAEVC